MLTLPLFRELSRSKSVLLAGAGGGFDLFSGLPLYFALRNAGKTVHLANLSFSNLRPDAGRHLTPECVEVTRIPRQRSLLPREASVRLVQVRR